MVYMTQPSQLLLTQRDIMAHHTTHHTTHHHSQLLLKQRDIMIALTQRLNERDEQIMALQDELDAYDRHAGPSKLHEPNLKFEGAI